MKLVTFAALLSDKSVDSICTAVVTVVAFVVIVFLNRD